MILKKHKDSNLTTISVLLLEKIREFNQSDSANQLWSNGITRADLLNMIEESSKQLSFLARYPVPLLQKLIQADRVGKETLEKYRDVFVGFGVGMDKVSETSLFRDYQGYAPSPEGYFWAWTESPMFDKEKEIKIRELELSFSKSFETKIFDNSSRQYIKVEEIENFIKAYVHETQIHWFSIFREPNIKWTNDLLIRYKDFVDWSWIHRNPSVEWNFELIESVKDRLNWSYISCCPHLNWTPELLDKHKEYLVFKHEKPNYDGNKYKGFGRSARGVASAILDMKNENRERNPYGNLSGIISDSSHLDWSIELIEVVKGYWDWRVLSANERIPWTDEWIEIYVELLDFEALSSNRSVSWSQPLISKYLENWDWEALTLNPSLPWSESFIATYEDRWTWKYYDDRFVTEGKRLSHVTLKSSISSNTGIGWTLSMLKRWGSVVDLWTIAGCGNLTDMAIIYSGQKLDESRLVGWKHLKFSDWRESVELDDTGWERMARNPKSCVSKNNVEYYHSRRISLVVFQGNARDGAYQQKDLSVLEVLKELPAKGFEFQDLVENEFTWLQHLLGSNFVNDGLWDEVIEELFTPDFIKEYLSFLDNNIGLLTGSITEHEN